MDPSTSTARKGRPPPSAAWRAGLLLIPANVTLVDGLLRLITIAALALLAAAVSVAHEVTFGRQAAAPDGHSQGSARLAWLRERRRPALIAMATIGTLALVGASLLTAPLVLRAAAFLGIPMPAAAPIAVVAGALAWTALVFVRPRVIAMDGLSRPACARSLAVTLPIVRVCLPAATAIAGWVDRVRARPRPEAHPISADDMRGLIDGEEAGEALAEEEAALIHSILEFAETTVREVMVPREDVVALRETATLDEALTLIREAGHSRYPLFGDNLDDIRGVVYAKDLLAVAGSNGPSDGAFDWGRVARTARFTPPDRNLDIQLADFRARRTHLAIVADELGATLGLVTLEDLLEEVVGEIRDELDEPEGEPRLLATGVGSYMADARLALNVFFADLGIELDAQSFAFETVGGLVFHLAGEVPEEGDEVTFDRLRLRVEALEANRISKVSVRVAPPPASLR